MSDKSQSKTYSMREIKEHNNSDSLWLLIDNSVYDVTKFMDEHPGGPEILLEQAGQDATEPFDEVGHSDDAKTMMKDYKIGELCEEDRKKGTGKGDNFCSCFCSAKFLIPVGIAIVSVFLAYKLYSRYK